MKNMLLLFLLGTGACQRSEPETSKPGAAAKSSFTAATSPPAQGSTGAAAAPQLTYSFDADTPGVPPAAFAFGRTGRGRPGRWLVQADTVAKSAPHVLAQLDADSTNFRFPVAVTAEARPANVRVSVSCKMISGKVDQACGLVVRFRDENNYIVTRANALEDNCRLYTVSDGKRTELASHELEVSPDVWHDYRFEADGDRLRVWWDGKLVLEHRDKTLLDAGSVGVWTKADSVTYFDDLRIDPLR
jgi:hypothetical protein